MIDKDKVKNALTTENIYELLEEWGGEPTYTNFGLVSRTICHNPSHEGKYKLYYYENNQIFKCYTECDETFDIFTLVQKVMNIQYNLNYSFYDSLIYIAKYFNLSFNFYEKEFDILPDWQYIKNYSRIKEMTPSSSIIELKSYDENILKNFNYNIKITPWINEGISESIMKKAKIGYYPGQDCITIPHFDINGNFIGLRGRTLGKEDAETYGKYRPLKINNILYSHPLGLNLYGLNISKRNIERIKTAIIVEGEKSVLQYASYFGEENNIAVACCGSTISQYQINLLLSLKVKEIIIAFDRQFQKIGDAEFKLLTKKLMHLHSKYKNYANISIIFDKNMITSYKASPLDEGPEKFIELYKNRIYL